MSVLDRVSAGMSNPLFVMGVGLMSGGDPGGTLAGGAQSGLNNMQAMQAAQQADTLNELRVQQAEMQLEEQKRKVANRKSARELINPLLQGTPQQTAPFEQDSFPGEAPIPGLQTVTQPAIPGMSETNPMMAAYLQSDPQGAVKAYGDAMIERQFASPATGTSDMQNYRAMVAMGYSPEEAAKFTFEQGSGTNINLPAQPYISGYDEEGRPLMSLPGEELGRGGKTKLQAGTLDNVAVMQDLNEMMGQYDTDHLTFQGQFEAGKNFLLDKAGLANPAQQQALQDYTAFKVQTVGALNSYIKSITGAAMTESEAKRIKSSFPNMDMSPAQFDAAIKEIHKDVGRALLRAELQTELGFKDHIELSNVQGLRRKVDELYEKRYNDNLRFNPPEAAKEMALESLRPYAEFIR